MYTHIHTHTPSHTPSSTSLLLNLFLGTHQLKKALEDSSAKSGDLSRANRELRGKVSELEKMVSNQRDRIKDQKTQLKQHLESRAVLINSHKLKVVHTFL